MKLTKGQPIELNGCGYNIKGYIREVTDKGFTFEEIHVKGRKRRSKGFYSISDRTLHVDSVSRLNELFEHFKGWWLK